MHQPRVTQLTERKERENNAKTRSDAPIGARGSHRAGIAGLAPASAAGMFGSVEPGLLIAQEGGKISFVTQQQKVFEAERHEIGVNWPWWEFGGGIHLQVAGKTYRLSLARPPSAPDINVGEKGLLSTLVFRDPTGISSLGRAFANGKAWKNYLNPSKG